MRARNAGDADILRGLNHAMTYLSTVETGRFQQDVDGTLVRLPLITMDTLLR